MRNGIDFPGKKVIDENESLIERLDQKYSQQPKGIEMKPQTSVIAINKIRENPNNPRTRIESVEDLKASIKASGLLQPIAVRALDYCTYEVIAGSRRFQACKELGMKIIPCTVFYDVNDATAYELATAENIVRENMTAVDEANAVAKLFAQGKSRTEIGAMFGKSARWAEGRRKIVELGDKAMEYLAAGKINLGHAEVLTMCNPNDVEKWLGFAVWNSPEDLKNKIMNERPLLERAPFDAKKVCKNCEKRSDKQTDLFGDVQCTYCLDRECFTAQVKKEAERIRKQYIADGYEEIPEDEREDAECGYCGWYDAETDDDNEKEIIEEMKAEGIKPLFWVNEKTCEHGLAYRERATRNSPTDSSDEVDTDSWDYQKCQMDYERKEKIRKEANLNESAVLHTKFKETLGYIRRAAAQVILELLGIQYENENGEYETYLDHPYEASDKFLDEICDAAINNYDGVNDDLRLFFGMESRETFEREANDILGEDQDPENETTENEEEK